MVVEARRTRPSLNGGRWARTTRPYLVALGTALAACHSQATPGVALTHRHDPAYEQQLARLQAEKVTVADNTVREGGRTTRVLTLAVLNPHADPARPDTLRQQVRKLARLVVADLAHPDLYQVVNVQVTFKPGLFARRSPTDEGSQSFIYPVAGLR